MRFGPWKRIELLEQLLQEERERTNDMLVQLLTRSPAEAAAVKLVGAPQSPVALADDARSYISDDTGLSVFEDDGNGASNDE